MYNVLYIHPGRINYFSKYANEILVVVVSYLLITIISTRSKKDSETGVCQLEIVIKVPGMGYFYMTGRDRFGQNCEDMPAWERHEKLDMLWQSR